jgi:hypothetical protein
MREAGFLLAMVLAAATGATAGMQTPANEPAPERSESAASVGLRGDVLSVDAGAKLIRLKTQATGEDPVELSLTVEGDAERSLADLKAGDVVAATCREGTAGAACVVTAIEKLPTS